MNIETVPIHSLVFDPANARKHDEKNIEAIKSSLARFKQQKPIVVDADNVVIAGNGTLEAAKALGWTEITIHRTSLRGPEAIAYAISDNRTAELADWEKETLGAHLQGLREDGWDLGDLGFELADLEELDAAPPPYEGHTDEDDVPTTNGNVFNVMRGDIWILGDHRLMCGDSTSKEDVERLMADEKAEFLLWDPPWNVDFKYSGEFAGQDNKPWSEYVEWMRDCLHNFERVMSAESASFVWGSSKNIAKSFDVFGEKAHVFVAGKNFVSMGGSLLSRAWDPVFVNYSDGYKRVDGGCNKDIFISNTANTRNRAENDGGGHPCPRHVDICEHIISNFCRGERVLDLSLGSGTTLIACEKTNRRCFGMEIDPEYCSVIIKRWQDFTGKEAHRANGTEVGADPRASETD